MLNTRSIPRMSCYSGFFLSIWFKKEGWRKYAAGWNKASWPRQFSCCCTYFRPLQNRTVNEQVSGKSSYSKKFKCFLRSWRVGILYEVILDKGEREKEKVQVPRHKMHHCHETLNNVTWAEEHHDMSHTFLFPQNTKEAKLRIYWAVNNKTTNEKANKYLRRQKQW